MATGDQADFTARLRAVLPDRWFPDTAPVLNAVLNGLASGWASLYTLLGFAGQQARMATAQGTFLDGAAADYLKVFPRLPAENDTAYSLRIRREVMRDRVTRAALVQALTDLGCTVTQLIEPKRTTDTGGYRTGGIGYGTGGAYGSLLLPRQLFLTVRRPHGGGIAQLAGYGTGGYLARGSLAQVQGQVTDAAIYAAINSVRTAGITVWTRITN